MKFPILVSIFGFLAILPSLAQLDIPDNPMVSPKKVAARSTGSSVNPGAAVEPGKANASMVRYTTHIVLFPNRMWSNNQGKPLEAGLIAFEDLVVQAPKGTAEPVMPAPPANPTLIRDGKIRLLIKKKPLEVELQQLSASDRDFIEQMKTALAKKAVTK